MIPIMIDMAKTTGYVAELIACNQPQLDEGIPWLLAQPAEVHVIRLQLTSRVDLRDYPNHVDWIIVEGGDDPLHPAWVRVVRDACTRFDCPFKFEGWGEWQPYLEAGHQIWQTMDGQLQRFTLNWLDKTTQLNWDDGIGIDLSWDVPGVLFQRVGRGKSGRLLDGREWQETPEKSGEWASGRVGEAVLA